MFNFKVINIRNKAAVVEGIKPCCYQKKDENRAESPAALNSCFGLIRPRHGVAWHGIATTWSFRACLWL